MAHRHLSALLSRIVLTHVLDDSRWFTARISRVLNAAAGQKRARYHHVENWLSGTLFFWGVTQTALRWGLASLEW